MQSSTRGWWRLANVLGGKRPKSSRVQALKNSTSEWARSPAGKAELLAYTFTANFTLSDILENDYWQLHLQHLVATFSYLSGRRMYNEFCKN